ncbi:MAG TPA: hypothetical protein VLK83_11865 [Rhodanobacteraceae bacterium]|nr:hypothetical protein [Rhodanobacteraceae bacterium]
MSFVFPMPNGYKLLGAVGADSAGGSWISGWTLLDVFVAAIVALLAWRLFGLAGVAITIGYLVLAYQESGAPVWTLLAALALGLVARARCRKAGSRPSRSGRVAPRSHCSFWPRCRSSRASFATRCIHSSRTVRSSWRPAPTGTLSVA